MSPALATGAAGLLLLVATLCALGTAVVLLAVRWYFAPWARDLDRRAAELERRRAALRRSEA